MLENEIFDITIIGGGPVGLFTAFYAGIRQAKTKIIDTLPQLGGQLTMLYPEKKIYDIAGFPEITAYELIDQLHKQNRPFQHTYCLGEEIQTIEKDSEGIFHLSSPKGEHLSKAVIITCGSGAFEPRRLDVAGSAICEDKTLHYFITNMNRFTGKKVIVCGGGDSAVDWALMLEKIADQVTLLHRRDTFRAQEHSLERLKNSSIKIKTPFAITKIHHHDGNLNGVTLMQTKTEDTELLEAEEVIVNYGFKTSIGPIKNWKIDLKRQNILVNSDMSTSVPGIYAAGDICTYNGKINLIATGFGEAPTAVNNALHFINPKNRQQPGHSTHLFENGIPQSNPENTEKN